MQKLWTRLGRKHRVTWELRMIPHGKGQFWWIGAPIVKYRIGTFVQKRAVQKRLNRSICRIGCGLEWAEGCTSSVIFARWRQCALTEIHVAVACQITMNHVLRQWCTLCQITLTTSYLWTRPLGQWHRKPSASSRVLYCGHSTQYSHLVTVSFAAVGRVSWNALVDSKDLIVLFGCQPVKQEAQPLQRDCTKRTLCLLKSHLHHSTRDRQRKSMGSRGKAEFDSHRP